MPSKRLSSASGKQKATLETCEFNQEQQDELHSVLEEWSDTQTDLSSMDNIIREMWLLYIRLLPGLYVSQQWKKDFNPMEVRRDCVRSLNRTLNHPPTIDDAIASLPQLARLSVATRKLLQSDLETVGNTGKSLP
jgi:hypothetical protein